MENILKIASLAFILTGTPAYAGDLPIKVSAEPVINSKIYIPGIQSGGDEVLPGALKLVFTSLADEITITGVTVNRGNCHPFLGTQKPMFSHPDDLAVLGKLLEEDYQKRKNAGACQAPLPNGQRFPGSKLPPCPTAEERAKAQQELQQEQKNRDEEYQRVHSSVTLKFGEKTTVQFACGEILEADVEWLIPLTQVHLYAVTLQSFAVEFSGAQRVAPA